jgi:hypothetical protein
MICKQSNHLPGDAELYEGRGERLNHSRLITDELASRLFFPPQVCYSHQCRRRRITCERSVLFLDSIFCFRQKIKRPFKRPPPAGGDPCTYLCGNSLGLLPRPAEALVHQEIRIWGSRQALSTSMSQFHFIPPCPNCHFSCSQGCSGSSRSSIWKGMGKHH